MHNIFINIEYVYLISTGINQDKETLGALRTLVEKNFYLNIIPQDKRNAATILKSGKEFDSFIKKIPLTK